MKKHLPLLCLVGTLLCACQAENETFESEKTLCPLSFSLDLEKEIIPFPKTKSMPSLDIPEPGTDPGKPDSVLSDFISHIEYVVYKEEKDSYVFFKNQKYSKGECEDFTIVYDTLVPGNYKFYFFCHNSSNATLQDGVLTFDEVKDSFFKELSHTVSADTPVEDITLERVVSRIDLMSTDKIENTYKSFEIKVQNKSKKFNLINSQGLTSDAEHIITHTFTPQDINKQDTTFSFYTFVAADAHRMKVNTSLYDEDRKIIRSREIESVTPYKNKIIRYKGAFFNPLVIDNSFNLSIIGNGQWDWDDIVDIGK